MEKNLEKAVEEILRSNILATKKLSRKVYSIIFGMIFLLTTIIIVEFKEYSHHYTEYKIGTKELGPKDLVWAGIMGTPPRYYESNEKYGLGYREFDTREIRKALEDAGINLVYRYMSPNRLEFEFERKHPICFYDRKWNNPKEYFKKKRHPILSIPLYYSGVEDKKIFFRKGEKARFQKHLDSMGNIILDSLIKDSSLKTELIRKVEYDGPYANISYGKRQQDGTYYDYVKQEFQKNIDLVILHTNDQIIQMLKWKRFDYQFFDTLEYDDYPWMDGGKNGIETLIYDKKSVQSLEDPNLIFHSVACGNHPLSKMAMPIINEVIKSLRSQRSNYNRAQMNEIKLNPLSLRQEFNTYLASENKLGSSIFQNDKWYLYQFIKMKIDPWPLFNDKKETSPLEIKKNMELLLTTSSRSLQMPHWNLIETKNSFGEKSLLIINDVELNNKYDIKVLHEYFLDKDYLNESKVILDRNVTFQKLSFPKIDSIQKLIIFARGIKDKDFELLRDHIQAPTLKSITLIEGSPYHSKMFLTYLPNKLEQLRLYDIPLRNLPFSHAISKLTKLKGIDIQSNAYTYSQIPLWLESEQIISMLEVLPQNLETFSLVGNRDLSLSEFPLEAATIFAKRKFPNLKQFTLLNFYMDNFISKLIFAGLPLDIESLILGPNFIPLGGVSFLDLENFLKEIKNIHKLKRLHLHSLVFSLNQENKLHLPESLEDFVLSNPSGLRDGNLHRIIIPENVKFKNLKISECNLNDYSIFKFLEHLDNNVENLFLEKNKLTGYAFFLLNKNLATKYKNIKIERLSLYSNPMSDFGIYFLSKLHWEIKNLNISNLKITDISSEFLTSNTFWQLSSLDLGNNYLGANSINKILTKHGKNLTELNLNNVLSLDFKTLIKHITPKLKSLSLEGNMISDSDIQLLAPVIQKNLITLNITGSRLSAKGALALAKKMPNLHNFNFDFKFGEVEESLQYIFQVLPSSLHRLFIPTEVLSYQNAKLLSQHIPPYLHNFQLPEFEKEECKVLLANLPHALKYLSLWGDLKSKGFSLNEIKNNYPSQLSRLRPGNSVSSEERDFFLSQINSHHLKLSPGGYTKYSHQFVKSMSFSAFLGNGPQKAEYFKNIILPPSVGFISNRAQDIPSSFLSSFHKTQLIKIRVFEIYNGKNLSGKEIIEFLNKLSPHLLALRFSQTNLKLEEVDTFIENLPINLQWLNISNNSFGEEGLKKFREYKRKREEKTGLPFILEE